MADFGGTNLFDSFYDATNQSGANLDMFAFQGLPLSSPNSFNGYSGGNAGGQAGAPNAPVLPQGINVGPGVIGGGSAGSANPLAQIGNAPVNPSGSAGAGITPGGVADYFARGVIIILGFIFVAVGLNMFRPGIVYNPAPGLGR